MENIPITSAETIKAPEAWSKGTPLEVDSLRKRMKFQMRLQNPSKNFDTIRTALEEFAVEDESGEKQVVNYAEGTQQFDNEPLGMAPLSTLLEAVDEIEQNGFDGMWQKVKNYAVASALAEIQETQKSSTGNQ